MPILVGLSIVAIILVLALKISEAKVVKFFKFGGIAAGLLFISRLAPSIFGSLVNLVIALIPFVQHQRKSQPNLSKNKMSKKEAREILGLGENATDEEIKIAYKMQMKKNHPDHGGSKYLAQKIILAKKTLIDK